MPRTEPSVGSLDFSDYKVIRDISNEIAEMVRAPGYSTILNNLIKDFAYQSIDNKSIVRKIFHRGAICRKTNDQIKNDLQVMIGLFLSRGNNLAKIISTSNPERAAKISSLAQIYGLKSTAANGGADTITLSRVAAVFPVITITFLSREKFPKKVTLSEVSFGPNFPRTMQTVVVAALFPVGPLGRDLMRALLLYLIEENKLIGKNKRLSDNEILTKVIPFARAAFDSSMIPLEMRVDTLEGVGIVVGGQISGAITPAVSTFKNRYPGETIAFI